MTFSELLQSDLDVYLLDNPIYHGMKDDPREDFRKLMESSNTKFYGFQDWERVRALKQAITSHTYEHLR